MGQVGKSEENDSCYWDGGLGVLETPSIPTAITGGGSSSNLGFQGLRKQAKEAAIALAAAVCCLRQAACYAGPGGSSPSRECFFILELGSSALALQVPLQSSVSRHS